MRVSGYVPCFNNASTIVRAVQSIANQSIALDEVFVVDDGSSDNSASIAATAGFRVVRLGENRGRGAVRARAVEEAKGDLILCCDATMELSTDFLAIVLPYFSDPPVAAVFGRAMDLHPVTTRDRWRARHLLKCHLKLEPVRNASFAGWGAVMRRDAVLKVGNFNARLRHSEDAEIGKRLLDSGAEVWFVPEACGHSQISNSLPQLMERFWRWNIGKDENFGVHAYMKRVWFSMRAMAMEDLRAHDPGAAFISLLTPHYFLWRRLLRNRRQGRRSGKELR